MIQNYPLLNTAQILAMLGVNLSATQVRAPVIAAHRLLIRRMAQCVRCDSPPQ